MDVFFRVMDVKSNGKYPFFKVLIVFNNKKEKIGVGG